MHELSITQGLVDAVLDRTGERTVTAVNLRVGTLSGVLPDAMRFCFDVVSAGTPWRARGCGSTSPEGWPGAALAKANSSCQT